MRIRKKEKIAISERDVEKIRLIHKRLDQEVGFYLPQYKELEICCPQCWSLWRVRVVPTSSMGTPGRWQLSNSESMWLLRKNKWTEITWSSLKDSYTQRYYPHSCPLQQNAKSWLLIRTICRGLSRAEPSPSSSEGDEQRLLGWSRQKEQNYQTRAIKWCASGCDYLTIHCT